VETTDSTLPMVLRMWFNMFFSTLSTFVVISYSTPLFMTIILPVLIFYVLVQVSFTKSWTTLIADQSVVGFWLLNLHGWGSECISFFVQNFSVCFVIPIQLESIRNFCIFSHFMFLI
jgi:hypothetical protein